MKTAILEAWTLTFTHLAMQRYLFLTELRLPIKQRLYFFYYHITFPYLDGLIIGNPQCVFPIYIVIGFFPPEGLPIGSRLRLPRALALFVYIPFSGP